MIIKGLAHYGYCVEDINRTIDFYTNIMGFKIVRGPFCSVMDEEMCAALGFEINNNPYAVQDCIMKNDAGIVLEFVSFENKNLSEIDRAMNVIGKGHIAYEIDDINIWIEKMKNNGIDVFYGPMKDESEEGSYLWIFVRDPNGICIELIQNV